MALTKIGTDGIKDDAVTTDKVENAINTSIAANTAKDLTALSASNLTSGTIPDARFPATLPAASAANLTAVPAANLTGTLPAISGANLTGISSAGTATNLIINGAMTVAQRFDTATTTSTDGSANYFSIDRMLTSFAGHDEALTMSQSDVASGTPAYQAGFRKAFKYLNGNQSSGADASDHAQVQYRFEAQDIANSGWDYTSSSSYVTLSFWMKSSVAQNFYVYLRTKDGTQQRYAMETGSLSANTWTKVTKTIPGNSNLQFDNNTENGLELIFAPYWGTTYTDSGVSLNTWGSYAGGTRTPVNTTTWWTTDNATWELTGLQLELGESATDFAFEPHAITKLKCQRYFNRPCCGMFHSSQSNADDHGIIRGFRYSTYGGINYCYPIEMRSNPTLTFDEMRDSDGSNTNITEQVGTQHISIFMLANNPYIADMRLDAEL